MQPVSVARKCLVLMEVTPMSRLRWRQEVPQEVLKEHKQQQWGKGTIAVW